MWLALALASSLLCATAAAGRIRKILEAAPLAARELAEALREAEQMGTRDLTPVVDAVAFEADYDLSRWKLVPKIAARVSSSCGFLCAAAQLRIALGDGTATLDDGLPPMVLTAVQIVAVALAGTAVCVAFGREATRLQRHEAEAIERTFETSIPRHAEPPADSPALFVRSDVEA